MTESIIKNTGENIGDIINGNNFMYAKNKYNWKYIVRRITNLQYIKYEALLNNNKIGIGYYLNDNIICKIYENIHKIECIRIEYYLNNILIYIEHKNDYINLVYSMAIDISSRYILNHKLYNKEGIITSVYYTNNNVKRINVFQKNNSIYNILQYTYNYDAEYCIQKQIDITEDDYINKFCIFYINDIYKLLYDIKNYIIKSPPTLLILSKRLLYTNDIIYYNYFYNKI
jgi:hypothetical protein